MKLSQNSTNVVVWEWMNEFGRWRPYAPHVTQFIENSYLTGSHNQQINLGSADTSLSSYAVDFVTTCQIRLGTGTARPIRRSTYPQSCPAGKGVVWQWEGDMQGQWHMYEMDIACVLEDSLSQNPKMPLLDLSKSTLKIPYHIDFSRMIQIRIETGRVRKIRRVSLKQAYPSGSNGVSTSSTVASSATAGSGANPSKRSSTSTHGIGPIKKIKSGFSQGVGGFAGNNNTNIAGGATHSSMTANPQQGTPHFSISNSHTNTTQLPPQSRRITRSLVSGQMGPGASQSFHPFQQNNAVSNIPHVSTIPQNSIIPQNPGMPQNSIIPQNPGMPQNSSIPQNPGMPQNMNYSSQHPLFPQAMSYMMNNGSSQNMGMGPSVSATQGFMGMYPGHAGLPGGRGFIGGHNSINLPSQGSAFSHPVGGRRSGSQHLDIPEEDRVPNTAPKQNKKGKMSDTEMFEQFTEVIQHPPPEEDCCICCEKLCQASGYGEGQMENHVVYQMNKCSHMFHKLCLIAMYESGSKNGSMQCPTCKTIYGEKHGNCPKGMMEYSTMSQSLPGYPDCQTIRIMYHVSPGVQTQEHPHPGKRFSCRGFPRVCFLPDNDSGRKILKLLIVAWKRRLTFTIGQSTTTGESDTVTWNEIHHKTEFGSNVSGHGFPDDKYFDNVLQELAVQGVTEKDI